MRDAAVYAACVAEAGGDAAYGPVPILTHNWTEATRNPSPSFS
jgi:hypothetical protein